MEVRLVNSVFYQKGDKIVECKLPEAQIDKIEIFDLPREHPAYSPKYPSKGVRAIEVLEDDTVVAFYGGIYRPGIFGDDNPYVFGLYPPELDLVIDAQKIGNIARYINDPKGTNYKSNLIAEDVFVQSGAISIRCVQFRTSRLIEIGEELFIDYEASEEGYWAKFLPEQEKSTLEIIDLTTMPENTLVIKRERLEQLEDLENSRSLKRRNLGEDLYLKATSQPVNYKILEDYDNLTMIKLCNNWKIFLTMPFGFCPLHRDLTDLKITLLEYWSLTEEFCSIEMKLDESNLIYKRQEENQCIVIEINGIVNRISPFPYTSLKNNNIFRFVVSLNQEKITSNNLFVIGNSPYDYKPEIWPEHRKEKLRTDLDRLKDL